MRIVFFVLLALNFCSLAQAEIQIIDEGQVLASLKSRYLSSPFSSITCGASSNYIRETRLVKVTCSKNGVVIKPEAHPIKDRLLELVPAECTPDKFSIFGPKSGMIIDVLREDYEQSHTLLVPILKIAGFFIEPDGTFVLKGVNTQRFFYIADGNKRDLWVDVVHAEYQQAPDKRTVKVELGFSREFSGIEKFVLFRMEGIMEVHNFLKLQGVVNAN